MTTKTIQACRLTTRHQLVTDPGELRAARQALRLAEVAVDRQRVEVRAMYNGAFLTRSYRPDERVRVKA
jgi:hypothetical protein